MKPHSHLITLRILKWTSGVGALVALGLFLAPFHLRNEACEPAPAAKRLFQPTFGGAGVTLPAHRKFLLARHVPARIQASPQPGSGPSSMDPVLAYSTYIGTGANDFVSSVAVDGSGNAYVAGRNTAGLVFVTKLSSDGTKVLYNIVLGSGYTGVAESIAVDSTGRAAITGSAGPGFPTTAGSFPAAASAGSHAFVAVLDPTGANLVYSSYLAGSLAEQGNGVAFDGAGNVYVAGFTESSDFPTTTGAFQTAFGTATRSGFVAKINPAATGAASLAYSTFLGGTATSASESAIAVDAAGNAYLTGNAGPGFPTTSGAFAYTGSESAFGGAFVTKLNPAGASLVYSAYLGFGQGTGIAVDGSGNAYVTGIPQVSDFPTTSGAYQTSIPGGFVTELNATGSALVYSTFLSGPTEDVSPESIALLPGCVSACSAYVAGYTSAPDFPTVNPIQNFNAGGDDAFVVALSGDGSGAVFSTYLGGSLDENNLNGEANVPGIAVTASGDMVVAGATGSSDFPVSLTATGQTQGFVARITAKSASELVAVPASLSFGTQVVGVKSSPLTVTLRNMGSTALNLTGLVPAGNYAQTNTCGTSIAGGGSCAVTVTFTPKAAGASAGTITVTDDAQNGPTNVINLSGSGTDAPVLNFSPAALNFGDQKVGSTSATQAVTLSNIGDQPLTLSSVSASGDFSETNNCAATLAPAASCTVSVSFKPTQPGLRAGTLIASSNTQSGGIKTVTLVGTGTGVGTSTLTVSTSGLAFANQALNSTSQPQTVILTNFGNVPITISSVAASGDFAAANSCPTSLTPAAACQVNVTFTPTVLGPRVGTLTVTDSTSTSPEVVALSGSGVNSQPEVTISPGGVAFLDQAVGTTSAQSTVTVSNTGNISVTISRVLVSGDFHVANNNCSGALAPGAQCQLGLTFGPTAAGPRTGALSIVDNAPGSPQTVSLSGNGLVAIQTVVVTPTSVDFPDQAVGTTSNSNTNPAVTITNTGNVPVTISGISPSAQFSTVLGNCGTLPLILYPLQYCSFNIAFSPATGGPQTGTVTITDNAAGSPQVITLAGNGIAGVLAVNVTPTGLDFADTPVNSTSNAQTFSVTNVGNVPVAVTSVSPSGDFVVTNSGCTATILAPNQSCTGNVAFAPTATGVRTGTLSVNDDAAGSPQTIALTGKGVVADLAIAITPPNMDFGSVKVGSAYYNQTAYVRNVGNEPVVFTNVAAAAGDFFSYSGCYGTLEPQQECNVYVSFTPTATGARTGSITFTDNASGSPQTMTLTGKGTTITPAATLSYPELVFDAQPVGSKSNVNWVYLYNNSGSPLTVSSIVPTGDFALATNNCTSILANGQNCGYAVTFTPTVVGVRTGTITITDTDPTSPQVQSVAGYAPAAVQSLIVSPTGLSFPNQFVNGTSNSLTVVLTNAGTQNVTVSSIVMSGDFAIPYNNCGNTAISPNSDCQFEVTFTPTTAGTRTGTVTITNSAPGSPETVTLTGQGVAAQQTIVVDPGGMVFPDQTVGTTSSQSQTVTITNTGTTPVNITNITASGDFSTGYGYCLGTLQPLGSYQSSCYLTVNFTPTAAGTRTGKVTITDNAAGSPQTVTLTGKGLAANQLLVINPTGLNFADQSIGNNNSQYVNITNTGNSPVLVKSVVASGKDFAISSDGCSNTFVQPVRQYGTNSCQFSVTFSPTVAGPHSGTVTITDGAPGSPQTVALTGNGVNATQSLTISPTSLAFGDEQTGVYCTPFYPYYTCYAPSQVVSLTNSGTTPITVSNVTVSGNGFLLPYNCGGQIAPGLNCSLYVYFAPSVTGNIIGALTIYDSAPGSPQTLSLSGTGISPSQAITLSQTSVNFGAATVGLTSAPVAVYYVNQGNPSYSYVSIYGIAASGSFAQTNNCGTFSSGGTSCSILITFTPSALGTSTGTVVITDSGSGSPRVINLTGTGVLPAFSASSPTLTFAAQPVGVASAAQAVTVTNTGAGVMIISSLTASGDFGQTNNCPARLAAGATCTVSVTFTPSSGGNRTGAITLTDNAPGSPQVVVLSGSGATPQASLSVTNVLFGSQVLNTTSLAQAVAITNTGNAALAISTVAFEGTNAGDFAKSADTCSGTSLAPTNSCTFDATFTPTSTGSRDALITIGDSATNSPQAVTLSGNGVTPDFTMAITPGAQNSATVTAGQSGAFTLAFSGPSGMSGNLSLACNDPASLSTCTVTPTSLKLNGPNVLNAAVTVSTTARGMGAPPDLRRPPAGPWGAPSPFGWLVLAGLLAMAWAVTKRAQAGVGAFAVANRGAALRVGLVTALLFIALLASVAMPSCGGSGTTPSPAAGTPAGTYNLSVTATFTSGTATVTHNIALTLTVN